MHLKLQLPDLTLTAANSCSCAYCGAVLAYTFNGVCYGLCGIQAIYAEQERCEKKSDNATLNKTRPITGNPGKSRKKQRGLFER